MLSFFPNRLSVFRYVCQAGVMADRALDAIASPGKAVHRYCVTREAGLLALLAAGTDFHYVGELKERRGDVRGETRRVKFDG